MIKWLPLLFLTILVACGQPEITEVEDQSVRPARIFQVTARHITIKHEFVGRVAAAQTVDMSFEVSGPLSELLVREGQFVEANSLIASLDPTDFKLAVRKASVQRKLAKNDLERKKKLLLDRGISKSLVDDALAVFELRQVNFEQANENLAVRDTMRSAETVANKDSGILAYTKSSLKSISRIMASPARTLT